MAAWLPLFVAALGPPENHPSFTPYNKRAHQVIYQRREGNVRHEIMFEYRNADEVDPYVERDGWFLLPHRFRVWNEVFGEWDGWWEEVSPRPEIAQVCNQRNKERIINGKGK
jgi:hypothetical protein